MTFHFVLTGGSKYDYPHPYIIHKKFAKFNFIYYLCQNFKLMKNIIYKPFIKSNKNDFPEITPRGYKRHYMSYKDVDDTEDETIVTETVPETEILEIDFSVPDTNYKFSDKESFKTRMLLEYRSALEARGINPEFAKYLVAQDALETG